MSVETLKHFGGLFLAALLLIFVGESTFVVTEWEHAVVTRFGKPVQVVLARFMERDEYKDVLAKVKKEIEEDGVTDIPVGPGVHFKMPFIDQVTFFDGKSILYTSEPYDIVTRDKKKINVDNYALWRVGNPMRFWRKVHDLAGASHRLDTFVFSILRDKVTNTDFDSVVRSSTTRTIETAEGKKLPPVERGREAIDNEVTSDCARTADDFGVIILDVRIRRAELPQENEDAVFKRMTAERERASKTLRAEGRRLKAEIEGDAARTVLQVRSEAERKAQETLGDGEAEAARTYADAYNQDKDFYLFLKSLETLERSIGGDTTVMMGTDKGIFKMLKTRE